MIAGGGEPKRAEIINILLAASDQDRSIAALYQLGQLVRDRPLWAFPDPAAVAVWAALAKVLRLVANGLIEARAVLVRVVVFLDDLLWRRPLAEKCLVSIGPQPIEGGFIIAVVGEANEVDSIAARCVAV